MDTINVKLISQFVCRDREKCYRSKHCLFYQYTKINRDLCCIKYIHCSLILLTSARNGSGDAEMIEATARGQQTAHNSRNDLCPSEIRMSPFFRKRKKIENPNFNLMLNRFLIVFTVFPFMRCFSYGQ